MKKILSFLLVMAVLASMSIELFANPGEATNTEEMEKVLIAVKQKIDIPEKFTEFTPSAREVYDTGKMTYEFSWYDKEGNGNVSVACDGEGRITRYYFYDSELKTSKKLSSLSNADIKDYANTFLKKALPEVYEGENNELVFDEEYWSVNNLNYDFRYKRLHNGVEVKDNTVYLNICIYDDVPYVRSMNTYLNYDSAFEAVPAELAGYVEKYKANFPIELVYEDVYKPYAKRVDEDDNNETALIYRFKNHEAGFILASSGEIAEEDELSAVYKAASGSASNGKFEASKDTAMREEAFTKQELLEFEKIGKLISKEEMIKYLEKLPYIGYSEELKMSSHALYLVDDRYMVEMGLSDNEKDRYIDAGFDGETGNLIALYNSLPYTSKNDDEDLSENEKAEASKKIDEFLEIVASEKLGQFKLQQEDVYGKELSKTYNREVNGGIRYISDSIRVRFNNESGQISSYSIDFEDDKIFENPDKAIKADVAYDALLKLSPIKKMYVHTGGSYKVCYAVSEYGTKVDAFSGNEYAVEQYALLPANYKYSDINGHWAEPKIIKLAEAQLGFEGEFFNPDKSITQLELLRLFAAAMRYKSYLTYPEENLYEELVEDGILTKEEVERDGKVMREDAFVYMVRLEGLERIAKHPEIFKVEYADGNLISSEKTGYPAILTGLGIICGNGGKLRPNEAITRAEAAVMVYNYLMN